MRTRTTRSAKVVRAGPSPGRRAIITISFVAALGIFLSGNPGKAAPALTTAAPATVATPPAFCHLAAGPAASSGLPTAN